MSHVTDPTASLIAGPARRGTVGGMTTDVIPVLHVADADAAVAWYARLGFEKNFEHRFEPGFPLYVGLRREGAQLHLSEHAGDATADTLVYVWVDDVDAIAAEYGLAIDEQPWAREIALHDLDGNRLRVGQAAAPADVDMELGTDTVATLRRLETAMWEIATRADRDWMGAHLTDDFTEFGFSGRSYDRSAILDVAVEQIEIELPLTDFVVRSMGRDAALVTYRSVQPHGDAHRTSVWRRDRGHWRLAAHQGTPASD